MDLSNYTIPLDTPISELDAEEAFNGLTDDEKYYCHFLSRGSWEGASICLFQTSPESVPLFLLLRQIFSRQSVASLRSAVGSSLSDDEFKVSSYFYLAIVLPVSNMNPSDVILLLFWLCLLCSIPHMLTMMTGFTIMIYLSNCSVTVTHTSVVLRVIACSSPFIT